MKTIVIGDRQTVLLFSMSGIEGREVANETEAIEAIIAVKRSKEYGLLIISERVALWAQDVVSRIRFSKSQLIIVEVPDKDGHIETGKTLADYIREAVGIRI